MISLLSVVFVPLTQVNVKANSRVQVCTIVSSYAVKSKKTYIIFDTVKTAQNDTPTEQEYPLSLTRIKTNMYSGSLDFDIIEDVIGIGAEVSVGTEQQVTVGQNIKVPAYKTYYGAFGSWYVEAQVQYSTRNSDCTRTWSGPIYTAKYSYDDYIGTYTIKLEKNKTYTESYLKQFEV